MRLSNRARNCTESLWTGTFRRIDGPTIMSRGSVWVVFVIVLILGYGVPAWAQSCEVPGRAYFPITVEAGPTSFSLRLDGVRATAQPPPRGTQSAVRAKGVLQFKGHTDHVPYRVKGPLLAADGVVELADWTRIAAVRAKGNHAVVDADLGGGVTIRSLPLPCHAMTVAPLPKQSAPLSKPKCGETYWHTLEQRWVVFHALPGHGTRVHVELSRPEDRLFVCEVDHKGAWLRVAVADTVHVVGGRITGWVPKALFRKVRGTVGFTGGTSMPVGRRTRGHATIGGTWLYRGPARLKTGAPVYVSPGGAQWATVRDSSIKVEVIIRKGNDWARLVKVPGLKLLNRAWVPRSAVYLP